MRISDWSSDVCSSDLAGLRSRHAARVALAEGAVLVGHPLLEGVGEKAAERRAGTGQDAGDEAEQRAAQAGAEGIDDIGQPRIGPVDRPHRRMRGVRVLPEDQHLASAEEHTSELQSLMRTSCAVVCLKKNTHPTQSTYSTTHYYNATRT